VLLVVCVFWVVVVCCWWCFVWVGCGGLWLGGVVCMLNECYRFEIRNHFFIGPTGDQRSWVAMVMSPIV